MGNPVPKMVEIPQILSIFNEVYGSRVVATVTNAPETFPLQQKILVCCLLLILKFARSKDVTLGKVFDYSFNFIQEWSGKIQIKWRIGWRSTCMNDGAVKGPLWKASLVESDAYTCVVQDPFNTLTETRCFPVSWSLHTSLQEATSARNGSDWIPFPLHTTWVKRNVASEAQQRNSQLKGMFVCDSFHITQLAFGCLTHFFLKKCVWELNFSRKETFRNRSQHICNGDQVRVVNGCNMQMKRW